MNEIEHKIEENLEKIEALHEEKKLTILSLEDHKLFDLQLLQLKEKNSRYHQKHFYSYTSISLLLISILYLLTGILMSARSFTRAFLTTTKDVARGELDSRLDVHTKHEYGKIAHGLNQMIEKLAHNAKVIDQYVDISETDTKGTIISVSSAFANTCGYSEEELIGKNHNIIRHPGIEKEFYTTMWETLTRGKTWEGELKNQRKDGSTFWMNALIIPQYNDEHQITGYISIRRNITSQKHIEKLVITDYLTQVYNRKHFNDMLNNTISLYHRYKTPFSLIMFDIDFFKKVNDKYGHLVGDECLIQLCALVKTHLRENDILSRWGGEEFMVLLPHTHKDEAIKNAEKLRSLVALHSFNEVDNMTISLGVVDFLPDDSFDTVIERIDKALYQAKDEGRNKVVSL